MAKKPSAEDQLVNLQASQLAAQVANWAAQLDFQKERMRLLELPQMQQASQQAIDELAFKKSQDTWQRAIQEASVSGTYNGVPTTEWLTQQAQLTGVLNGQQTIQGKLTDAQIAQMNASMANTQRLTDLEFAKYNTGREQWDAQHQMDLEKQQADLTGMINGLPTFQREQWEAQNKLATANLIASLSGPASAFKQVAVIRNLTGVAPTIGGVTDSIRSVLQNTGNRNQIATFGQGTGGAEPANPYSSYYDQSTGAQPYTPANPVQPSPPLAQPMSAAGPTGASAAPYSIEPTGVQADPQGYNYQPNSTGGTTVYPPGVIAPYTAPQATTAQPVGAADQATLAAQAGQANNTAATAPTAIPYQAPQATQPPTTQGQTTGGLLPSQISATNYNAMTDYEKQLTWAGFGAGAFGSGAYDPDLAKQLYQQSLPKYASPAAGKVSL